MEFRGMPASARPLALLILLVLAVFVGTARSTLGQIPDESLAKQEHTYVITPFSGLPKDAATEFNITFIREAYRYFDQQERETTLISGEGLLFSNKNCPEDAPFCDSVTIIEKKTDAGFDHELLIVNRRRKSVHRGEIERHRCGSDDVQQCREDASKKHLLQLYCHDMKVHSDDVVPDECEE